MQTSENPVNNSSESKPATLSNISGFDEKQPPNPELIDSCVHCGFCLSTCPSYRVIGKEMDPLEVESTSWTQSTQVRFL
jgi:glycolate oxidase iron-sulfur subunit